MSEFQPAIEFTLQNEGSAFIAQDNGRGCSKWGITLASAQEFDPHATAQDIANLTRDQASNWYQRYRWLRYRIGLIQDQNLATKIFDILVNEGAGAWVLEHNQRTLKEGAITILQRIINVPVDGILGPATAAAVNALDAKALLGSYKSALVDHYRHLVLERPELQKDLTGWIARANA